MTHFIDPTADLVFDAVVFESSTTGTTHTMPVSDEDWTKVERGAWQLAECYLLMIPRQAEPADVPKLELRPGESHPELSSGSEIDAKINADRSKWNDTPMQCAWHRSTR